MPELDIVKEAPICISEPVIPFKAFIMRRTCAASIKLPLAMPEVLMYPIKISFRIIL